MQSFHAWDLLLVFVLTAIALVGWESTYLGIGWWVAGGIAALVGISVAVLVTAARGGVEIVVLVLLILYYLACGPIVDGVVRFDGLRTFEAGIQANTEGWPILLGTHPPVDATGAVLLAPVLLCLTSAGLGSALAIQSTRAALPLVPPTLMLAAVLLLGQPAPVSTLLQGAVYGAVALVWMRLRGLRIDEAAYGRDPSRRWRLLTSVALVIATAAGAALLQGDPTPGERFVLSRELPAYDVGEVDTPLDDFRDYTKQKERSESNVFDLKLLTVKGAPRGTRLRMATLDSYDGTRWRAENETDPGREDDRFLRLSSTIDNPAQGREVDITVRPTANYVLPWVPTAGAVQSFSFFASARDDAQTHLRYNPATQTALMDDRLEKDDVYAFVSRLSGGLLKPRMRPSRLVDRDLFEKAEFLDPAIQAWTKGAKNRIDALFRVARELKRVGRYSDGANAFEEQFRSGHSEARLGKGFVLADPTVGDDEQYAAVMALVANRLQVPARVVMGAVLPENGVVHGRDVEAWVEVRITDGSWRTLPTDTFMSRKPPKRKVIDEVPPRVFNNLTTPQPEPEFNPPLEAEDPEPPVAADPGLEIPWRWILLVLLVVAVAAVPVVKLVRRRRRLGARRVSARYSGAWLELVDHARDLGVPIAAGLTRPAQARAVAAFPGTSATSATSGESTRSSVDLAGLAVLTDLAQEADRRIYASDSLEAAEAAAFWSLVRSQRASLGTHVTPWRRLWAVFNPASLRRDGPLP